MSDDELPPNLPDDFVLNQADDLEKVVATDGREYRVLVSHTKGRTLVNADIVEYNTWDHPVITGVLGFYVLLVAVFAPLAAGYYVATTSGGVVTLASIVGAVAGMYVLPNLVLYYTRFGDWLWRFLEWNDHRTAIMAKAGESA